MVQQLLKCLASSAALHGKSSFPINCASCYSWLTGSESANSMFHVLGLTLPFPAPLITESQMNPHSVAGESYYSPDR